MSPNTALRRPKKLHKSTRFVLVEMCIRDRLWGESILYNLISYKLVIQNLHEGLNLGLFRSQADITHISVLSAYNYIVVWCLGVRFYIYKIRFILVFILYIMDLPKLLRYFNFVNDFSVYVKK